MIDDLKRLFNLCDGEKVKYDDLEKVKVGVWNCLHFSKQETQEKKLINSVWYKRYETKSAGQLIFLTRIFEGNGYHYHSHDCKETITPMNGSVVINNRQLLKQDKSYTFFANTKHKVDFHSSENKYVDVLVEFNRGHNK